MDWIKDALEKTEKKLEAEAGRMGEKIPYIAENGQYEKDMRDVNLSWWTNGFWAGIMWQMYQASGKEIFKEAAERTEKTLDGALENYEGLHHDVGFMWMHTAAADYRLTQNPMSKKRALHAANLLAGRFNYAGKFIRAWNLDKTGWMIVDCMMNLPLLYWAAQEADDPRYTQIANMHADTAMKEVMRPDGSCNHIVVFDPESGAVMERPGGQGYGEGSSWSRGQAWALYGFALAYFHTGKQEYLDTAKRAAHYFIANIAMTDYVSLSDFRAPEEPVVWDTTAAACAACGLLQIAEMVPELEKRLYYFHGEKIIKRLTEIHCCWDEEKDGILQYGTAAYHRKEDAHVPIIYGDYFLTEGLLRLAGKGFMIW